MAEANSNVASPQSDSKAQGGTEDGNVVAIALKYPLRSDEVEHQPGRVQRLGMGRVAEEQHASLNEVAEDAGLHRAVPPGAKHKMRSRGADYRVNRSHPRQAAHVC